MEKLKVAVVGVGIQGELHVRAYSEMPYVDLVALCDISEEQLQAMGKKYSVKRLYTDYEKMIAESGAEAISIATPDAFHAGPTIACLKANKHVLVEKPLTTDVKEADEILAAERKSKCKLMTNFTHRWHPAYYQSFASIKEGKIGEPILAYTRKNDTLYVSTKMIKWANKSSPALFLSAHDIDLVRWFFNAEATEVYATGVKKVLIKRGIDTYDVIQAQVRFNSGAVATFESCWIYPDTFPTIVDSFVEIIGTEGVIHLDRKSESIELATKDSFTYPKTFLVSTIFGKMQGAFQLALAHFVDCVTSGKPVVVTGRDGRQVTSILDAIHRSLSQGKPVTPL